MAPHPTGVATEGHIRKLKRSSLFSDALKRILPSNRPERGYTLREQYRMSEDGSQDHVKSMFGSMSVAGGPATLTPENKGEEKKRPGVIRRLIRSLGSLKEKKNEKLDTKSIINNSGDEQRAPSGMNVANGPAATLSGMNVPNRPVTLTSETKSKSKPAVEKKPAAVEEATVKEERRRFRRSEDYLGVQGANPTTGTWDSDPTSTTEQMSEETQKRVDDHVKVLVEAKKRVEAAQKLEQEAQKWFQDTLQKVQALRDVKKEEKEEKEEKLVKKMSRRRGGKWRLTESGWRSTELSPIAQSPGEYWNKC
jgi:hypothetical protein